MFFLEFIEDIKFPPATFFFNKTHHFSFSFLLRLRLIRPFLCLPVIYEVCLLIYKRYLNFLFQLFLKTQHYSFILFLSHIFFFLFLLSLRPISSFPVMYDVCLFLIYGRCLNLILQIFLKTLHYSFFLSYIFPFPPISPISSFPVM